MVSGSKLPGTSRKEQNSMLQLSLKLLQEGGSSGIKY